MQPILVTGANGFLGRAVCADLQRRGLAWRTAVRAADAERSGPQPTHGTAVVGELGPDVDWRPALHGACAVIHLAGAAHAAAVADPAALMRVNSDASRALAVQARAAGVARFVLASSVKAMGEKTPPGRPWNEDSACAPADAYGCSKLAAESAVRDEFAGAVVLRLPLVYGPGVRANLRRLMLAVLHRRLLPFASLRNRRSLIGRANAADALILAAMHPGAAGGTFLLRDADWSTPELLREIGEGLGVAPRLIALPEILLRLSPVARPALRKMTGSLLADDARIRSQLGWSPLREPRRQR
jgi:UDP-glucose 4-epimerase